MIVKLSLFMLYLLFNRFLAVILSGKFWLEVFASHGLCLYPYDFTLPTKVDQATSIFIKI